MELNAQQLFERFKIITDKRSGIISNVMPMYFPPGSENQVHGYSVDLGRPNEMHPKHCAAGENEDSMNGCGTAVIHDTAKIRALCESVERYCSILYQTRELKMDTFNNIDEYALDPMRLLRCSDAEIQRTKPAFMTKQPDRDSAEPWMQGFSLTHNKPIWVPLTAVYLGLPFPLNQHLQLPMSSGFAAGSTYQQAVLSGITELIERDSLSLWWLHQLPMPRIDPDSFKDPAITTLINKLAAQGVQSHLLDLTTELGIPVVGIVQTSETSYPHALSMGACRLGGEAAALRALEEGLSLRVALAKPDELVNRQVF